VARKRDDVHLVIAGPDNEGYGQRVRLWLDEENVSDRVTFTGMLLGKDKMSALRDAYLYILPSYTENFGISVVEAMACGLPVIISDQVNIYREVGESGAGKITSCDAGEVAVAILELVENPESARTMGQKGLALVKECFQWQEVAKTMIAVYCNILANQQNKSL
jgi:glycosyltransferase involved in cell wall biosynthesis